MVAVGQRREALHVDAEHPRERVGLGVAELGELLGHVLTGQCPWHSWMPTSGEASGAVPTGRADAA